MKTFIIASSNPNSKEGFVTKLQCETTIKTPFGDKVKKETYYVSGSKQMTVDSSVDVDMSMFTIGMHEMVNPSTSEVFMAKWLHLA